MDVSATVKCAGPRAAPPLYDSNADASNRASRKRFEGAAEPTGMGGLGAKGVLGIPANEPSAPQQGNAALPSQALQDLLEEVNGRIESLPATSVQFSIDEAGGRIILLVVDKETQEVVRQIPPEEFLAISRRLEELRGLILDRSG